VSRAQRLYQLQTLDSDLDKVKRQLTQLAAQLGESQALKTAQKAVEAAEQLLRQAQTLVRDLELEVKSLSQKIAQQEKTLYSGKNLSAKESANLQGEVASLKRRQSQREEAQLEAMVQGEEAEAKLNQARAELTKVQAAWTADQDKLVQNQGLFQVKMAELTEQRPSTARGIDSQDAQVYESLRPRKGGVAVVMVQNNVCQGCGMAASSNTLQRARAGAELVYCDGCGRIMYVV
jgi:predicted  nucleic acid-binding Zn-ribbon protein